MNTLAKRSKTTAVLGLGAMLMLAGCSGLNHQEQRTVTGGLIGAGGGALIGAAAGNPLAGAAVGGVAGAAVGGLTDIGDDHHHY